MDPEDANTPTTRLLTLLNVSALKSRKRPTEDPLPREKLNKRKALAFTAHPLQPEPEPSEFQNGAVSQLGGDPDAAEQEIDGHKGDQNDIAAHSPHDQHFGPNPEILTEHSRTAVDQKQWKSHREKIGKLNAVASLLFDLSLQKTRVKKSTVLERLLNPFEARQAKQLAEHARIQDDLLSVLSAHLDVYHTCVSLEHHQCIREVITLHALDHVTKKRRRVLKNNDRISYAKSTSSDPPEDVQDQGFTRPSVLFLLPLRSSALAWLNALTTHTPSPSFQIENHTRFLGEYGLPPDALDKLATAPPGTYPPDHVEMFKGNVDDNFRLGIKMTRKSVKLFSDFYNCDLILASPLGLRMSIEKQKSSDFLSSIEILVIDQMNALTMQNWEHVQFVLSHLNKMPKESHDADFSRIKPWYLDGFSSYLRQSILLSPFEMSETRSLYNTSLKNVAGKIRVEKSWPALHVPEGIDHTFLTFDCLSPREEADKRFSYFTTQLLPKVLKSAVQSANTVVFIPSSFDFIRVHNYFRRMSGISFTVLSEYSSNQDIARARQAFFSGKQAFLLISERFHFYRRYKIRGIRNILFYGPPTHPQFFSEFLTYPFLDEGVDPSDVTCRVACCRYDWFKLERMLGSRGVKEVLNE
ncbi:digestive organ expansion factor [Boletus edulis]|nr:digestive organ expansion factor [Boletus edulis]